MNNKHLDVFYSYLENFNRESALQYAMDLLSSNKITVVQLFEQIITPSLNRIEVCRDQEDELIWQEHTMTNIARTVVECSYPFVLQQKNPHSTSNNQYRVLVACPEDEYHDIGARMGADFFVLENYSVTFIGANTPASNIISSCKTLHPHLLAISISNMYHLVSIKETIQVLSNLEFAPKVVLSGSALLRTGINPEELGAFAFINTYKQVENLGGLL